MLITRKSQLTGEIHTMDIAVTPKQMEDWEAGMHIQHAMRDVPAPLREFIKTGITPDEWEAMVACMEDDSDPMDDTDDLPF